MDVDFLTQRRREHKGSLKSYESRRDGIFVTQICENRLSSVGAVS